MAECVRPFRVAYFVSHPIQYQVPLLRAIAADPEVELHVYYYSDFSLGAYHDQDFQRTLKWDTALTGGYDFTVLPRHNWLPKDANDSPFVPARKMGQIFDAPGARPFDVIWVHGWSHVCSWQAILAANRRGIPVLIRGDSNVGGELATGVRRHLKHHVLRRLFQRVSGFLSAGTSNRQFYLKYGASPKRVFHLPYAVDNAEFQSRSRLADAGPTALLREELGLDPLRQVILFAAKLTDVKDPGTLLQAYRLLIKEHKTAPDHQPYLIFVGDGVLRPALERQAASIDSESFRFAGFRNQSEMPVFYSLCDLLVLPSRFEPWGLVVNEAMNAGRAIVVSDLVGCASDLVADGVNGRVFPAGDAPALAAALRWTLDHAREAGEASLRRIADWSFEEDLVGLKQALAAVGRPVHGDPTL